jgi:hypothetical protein
MADDYDDGRIRLDGTGLTLRGYYFPWGSKHIGLASITELRRVELAAARGRARIWGTANPRYWANFDPARPKKSVGFVLELGKAVRPLITPDDPDAFEAALRSRRDLPPQDEAPERGPVI